MQGWFFVGLGVGVGIATAAAWFVQRRQVRRVRAAERRARAAERMAEIGSMTGGLAHEIKNPLSTIGLNAQLLQEAIQEQELPEDERTRLLTRAKSLRRETDRLAGILSDFLEYAGEIRLEREPAELNAVLSELADFFLPEAERHGVRLRIEAAGAPVEAEIDVKRVKQALLNLMLNATQAMHARLRESGSASGLGGRIVGTGAAGDLILRAELGRDPDGRRVARMHVIDTGPGIAPETLARIFNPYFTTRAGGSGLGLPTSRRLIEEHGGRIDVHSELDRGSDFAVVIPLEPPAGR